MTPEEAKQAWKKKAYEQNELAGRHLYYLGIEDFKSALREEIEKDIVSRGVSGHYADGRTWAFKRVLQLIDTITPKQ